MTNQPRRIGKFEILERLGEGVLGEVFLARDVILGREVALKIIQPEVLTAPEARDRFFREAQATGRLHHPNLVTVHEFGEDQGVYYLAMDFVPGEDLAQALAAKTLAPRDLLELLAQVCDGLAFAHQRGVHHRDLRPSNIRVTRIGGRLAPKVLDFGLARLATKDLAAVHPDALAYLAPEQTQSGKPDPRADVFAVGVILYEALAGFSPFAGQTAATVLHRLANEEPQPLELSQLDTISPAIQGVIAKALAKSPAGRYPSAEALATALRAARDPLWDPGVDKSANVRSPLSFDLPARQSEPGPGVFPKVLLGLAVPLILAGGAYGGRRWLRHHPRHAVAAVPQPAPQPVPPPPPIPAPAPAPEPAQPAARPGYASLDEAGAALETDPKGTLPFLEDLVQREPGNERALVLRIVALYASGDYKACGKAMFEARTAGHPLWPLALKYPQLRKMLEQEKIDQRLPRRKPEAAPAT